MIVFWTVIFYSNSVFFCCTLLYLIYEKIKKKEGFRGVFMMSFSLFIMFFSQSRLCNGIVDEIISDLKTEKLILKKNNILTNQNIYNLQTSSQKHNFSDKTYVVTVLPSKDSLIIKEDFSNHKYWVFYSKYYYSRTHAIGYIE